jgi:hypothetical protein
MRKEPIIAQFEAQLKQVLGGAETNHEIHYAAAEIPDRRLANAT